MRKTITALFLSLSTLLFSSMTLADSYSDSLKSFRMAGETDGFFNNAYGYALFPTIGKGGMGIGGAHGKGRVYRGGTHVGNTSMTQVTVALHRLQTPSNRISGWSTETAQKDAPKRVSWRVV